MVKYPEVPIFLTSSTVDSYGRAAEMEEGEVVKEYELLNEVLKGKAIKVNNDNSVEDDNVLLLDKVRRNNWLNENNVDSIYRFCIEHYKRINHFQFI